jgi:hypothetical protein
MSHSITLALELSTPRGHIALWQDGAVLYEKAFVSERSHNSMLYDPLREALALAGEDLKLIVVGTGPGSYTGVRISIAAAQGLALSKKAAAIGWPSIAALDDAPRYGVLGDARRGKHYAGLVENGSLVGEVQLLEVAESPAWMAQHAIPFFSSDTVVPGADVAFRQPCAVRLAARAAALGEEAVWTLAERPLEPLYVQEAFITQPKRPKP